MKTYLISCPVIPKERCYLEWSVFVHKTLESKEPEARQFLRPTKSWEDKLGSTNAHSKAVVYYKEV